MKFFKLIEHSKQYFVSGKFGKEKERLVGEHEHVIGYFNDVNDAIAVGEELETILPPSRIIENNDGLIYSNEYHHFRMDYELEVEVVELEVSTENMPTIVSKDIVLNSVDFAPILGLRAFQDSKYPKVRYHNHNNRIYLYANEKDEEPISILEDAIVEAEEEKQ